MVIEIFGIKIGTFTLSTLAKLPPVVKLGIPFLLVFALVFTALEDMPRFGNRTTKLIVSIVLAIFAVTYDPFVNFLWAYMPWLVGVLLLIFIARAIVNAGRGIIGKLGKGGAAPKEKAPKTPGHYWGIGVATIFGFIALATVGREFLEVTFGFIDVGNLLFILAIINVAIIAWAAMKASEAAGEK